MCRVGCMWEGATTDLSEVEVSCWGVGSREDKTPWTQLLRGLRSKQQRLGLAPEHRTRSQDPVLLRALTSPLSLHFFI